MSERIVCAGHPRDMGLAQGRQLRELIATAVVRAGLSAQRSRWPSLRAVVSGPLRGRGAGRELFRHFAHQAERLEGLAHAANLPLDSLLELQLRMGTGGGGDESAWIVRESRPVVGFRSLELTLPWLVPAVAGVNEAGLAVIARLPESAAAATRGGDAPPILLVQDCLARFEHLAGALDWCRRRPVGGVQTILLGDGSGARATIEFRGRERHVESGPADAAMEWDAGLVRIDPVARRLWLERPGGGGVDSPAAGAGSRGFGFAPLPPKGVPPH